MNDDTISRQAALDALKVAYWDNDIQSAKDDPCIVDAMTDWAIRQIKALPSAERSLWFRIGEVCVDESKGFISAGRAVEKIRELLREAEMGGEE